APWPTSLLALLIAPPLCWLRALRGSSLAGRLAAAGRRPWPRLGAPPRRASCPSARSSHFLCARSSPSVARRSLAAWLPPGGGPGHDSVLRPGGHPALRLTHRTSSLLTRGRLDARDTGCGQFLTQSLEAPGAGGTDAAHRHVE